MESSTPFHLSIAEAARRLDGRVLRTPVRRSYWLSAIAGTDVWLKLECVQLTGSFKIRGALNAAILHAERHSGLPTPLVTASAGNHGRALALAAEHIGIPLTVFVPEDAPRAKTSAIESHGAVLRRAPDYDAAEEGARAFARENGATYISPYNDPDVIAGAATVALEVFEDLPDTRVIVVPVGGGGLAGGIGAVARLQAGGVRTIGVETESSHAISEAFKAGRIVTIEPRPTIADALSGNIEPGSMTFPLMQQVCDGIVLVGENELKAAIVGLVREEHVIAEGGGAAAVAAILAGPFDSVPFDYAQGRPATAPGPIVAIVSGSNIDVERLAGLLR